MNYIETLNDILIELLSKRIKYLSRISDKSVKDGYSNGELKNLMINEDNFIIFDSIYGKKIRDCGFSITEKTCSFTVVGNEGEEDVRMRIGDDINIFLKNIKKIAKEINCGGLK